MVNMSSLFMQFSLLLLPLLLFTRQHFCFPSAIQPLPIDLHWLSTKSYLQPLTSEEVALIRLTAAEDHDKICLWPVWCHAACHPWKLAATITFELMDGSLMIGCQIVRMCLAGCCSNDIQVDGNLPATACLSINFVGLLNGTGQARVLAVSSNLNFCKTA